MARGSSTSPDSPRARERPAFRWQTLHVLGLSAIAVAQPLFDTIARNSEFLVAHRPRPAEVVALAAVLTLLVPAVPLALAWLAGRVHRRLGNAVFFATLLTLALLVALQVLRRAPQWPLPWTALAAAGSALAFVVVYGRFAAVRSFASLLSAAAVVVVPAAFLLDGSIVKFWRPRTPAAVSKAAVRAGAPVVMLVFDQLPLASLLDAGGQIDAALYPSFAALSRDSVWFRNATAVAERTQMGLPSIVTGRYPRPSTLPSETDHPTNLFTWLGSSYRVRAFEPITAICPTSLCDPSVASGLDRLRAILGDLSTVYLHLVAPAELAVDLPPVTQNWRDFEVPTWQRRWRQRRHTDRRESALALVDALAAPGARPTFYFSHVLLPHEPFVYLPSGRRYDLLERTVFGLLRGEVWTADPWPVAVNYQRHLLQMIHVDRLLGRVIARLRDVGLYDECLLVLTSDHGSAFVPGEPFKDPTEATYAEIMAVPLFVKLPHQRDAGRIDEGNVETIDVVPTVAAVLGAKPPWPTDGASAFSRHLRLRKRVFWAAATRSMDVSPSGVASRVRIAAQRKYEMFGTPPDVYRMRGIESSWQLVGRRVADLPQLDRPGIDIALDDGGRYADVDPGSAFQPALVVGKVASTGRTGPGATVAVAINGVIRSVARSFHPFERIPGMWMSLVPEDVFEPGMNHVQVFEVVPEAGDLRLRRTRAVSPTVTRGNLLERAWAAPLGVRASGFHAEEPAGGRYFRWTRRRAEIEVPFDAEYPPRTLTIGVLNGGRPNRRFEVRAGGCELFGGTTPAAGWRRTFPLDRCGLAGPSFTIELVTETFTPGGRDRRELGVGVDYLSIRSR